MLEQLPARLSKIGSALTLYGFITDEDLGFVLDNADLPEIKSPILLEELIIQEESRRITGTALDIKEQSGHPLTVRELYYYRVLVNMMLSL